MLLGSFRAIGRELSTALTESSSLTFSPTAAASAAYHQTYLVTLENNLNYAMQSEQYEEANHIKREIILQLQPSQRAQRELERQQVVDMERQLNTAVIRRNLFSSVKRWGGSALASWRSISGSELEFTDTPSKQHPPSILPLLSGHPSEGSPRRADGSLRSAQTQSVLVQGRGDVEAAQNRTELVNPKNEAVAAVVVPPQKAKKDEFTITMEILYGALGAENPDLSLAAECALKLLELLGGQEEAEEVEEGGKEEDNALDTRVELAGACYDKVQQTVRRTLADLTSHTPSRSDAPSSPTARSQTLATKSGGKTLPLTLDEAVRKALGLCRVAITMELEEEAAACLKALLLQQIKEEADARVAKIEAGMRLADSIRAESAPARCCEGASVTEWFEGGAGVLKGEDPVYISSLTAVLNAAASSLDALYENLSVGGGHRRLLEAHLPLLAHSVLLQACEGARRLMGLYKDDRNASGLARSARDGEHEQQSALRAGFQRLDLLLDELAHLLMVCNRFLTFVDKYRGPTEQDKLSGVCGFAENHLMLFDQELQALAGHFVVLEEVYLNSCVERARLSSARNPDTNTAVAIEDVFFLVQKCSMRAYKTCSLVAALPMGNSIVEILREHIHQPLLLDSHTHAARASGEATSSKDALSLMGHLNDLQCSSWCTQRLRSQLSQSFVANFPAAGEKMLGAMQMELDDIKGALDKLHKSGTAAVVSLIAPDVVGQVDRMLSRANFAAHSADAVFSADQPKRGLLSKLTGAKKEEERPGSDGVKGGGGPDPLPLASRLQRAVSEVVLPLRPVCDSKVLEAVCTCLLERLAGRLEGIVASTVFSEAGGLSLQAQLRGIISIFTRGQDMDDPEEGALIPEKTCRDIMKRARAMSLLVSVERVGDAVDIFKDLEDGTMSKEEARNVLRSRQDLDSTSLDTLFR